MQEIAVHLAGLQSEVQALQERSACLNQLSAFQDFRELDWRPLLGEIERLASERRQLEEASDVLRALEAQLVELEARMRAAENALDSDNRELATTQTMVVPSEADALALIGKRRQAEAFDRLVQMTREAIPALVPWIARRPMELLEHASDWERMLAVVSWFCANPHPGLYCRQIDVPGVHSKFIESRRRLLAELLDLALPSAAIDAQAIGAQAFEQRYGLLSKPAMVRFRILDQRLRLHGLDDLATPSAQFAQLDLPACRVFITENEVNGLAFPALEDSLVVFGLGYGLDRLAQVPWLKSRAVFYWGDIDTHGFAILDSLRAFLRP